MITSTGYCWCHGPEVTTPADVLSQGTKIPRESR